MTPVISTDCPEGPKEILTGKLAEFLYPVSDEDAFSQNIREVIEKPPTIRENHIAKFDSKIAIKKYLDLLKQNHSIK